MSICMLYCDVHMSYPQSSMCTWTILMEMLQISLLTFHFQFFSVFPLLHILSSSHFIQKHQTSPGLFSFPLKPSPSSSSSLKNHHLHQSTLEKIPFWRKISSSIKVKSCMFVFHSLLFVFSDFCDYFFIFVFMFKLRLMFSLLFFVTVVFLWPFLLLFIVGFSV